MSTKRIEEFMSLPEIPPNTYNLKSRKSKNNKHKQMVTISLCIKEILFVIYLYFRQTSHGPNLI